MAVLVDVLRMGDEVAVLATEDNIDTNGKYRIVVYYMSSKPGYLTTNGVVDRGHASTYEEARIAHAASAAALVSQGFGHTDDFDGELWLARGDKHHNGAEEVFSDCRVANLLADARAQRRERGLSEEFDDNNVLLWDED